MSRYRIEIIRNYIISLFLYSTQVKPYTMVYVICIILRIKDNIAYNVIKKKKKLKRFLRLYTLHIITQSCVPLVCAFTV